MTTNEANEIIRRPADATGLQVRRAALIVLGHEGVDLSAIERAAGRWLTLAEEDIVHSAAAWRNAVA